MAYNSVPAPNSGFAKGLSNTIASISGTISDRLRNEDLRVIKQFRDNSLQLMGDDSDFARSCREEEQLFWERTWHNHLNALRSELPNVLNRILDALEEEFGSRKAPTTPRREQNSTTPLTPQSASNDCVMEIPVATGIAKADSSKAPMAPMAPMEGVSFGDGNESPRSSCTMPVSSPTMASNKRPLDHGESSKETNKRAKNIQQDFNERVLTLDQVKHDECIYKYRHHEGFYVLRCLRDRCKKANGGGMIYFKSNPFKGDRAMGHFVTYGHGVKETDKIFQKYAWRVINATEERNTRTTSPRAHPPLPDGLTSPPKTPPTARDKGKAPERLIDLTFRDIMSSEGGRAGASTAATSSSSSTAAGPSAQKDQRGRERMQAPPPPPPPQRKPREEQAKSGGKASGAYSSSSSSTTTTTTTTQAGPRAKLFAPREPTVIVLPPRGSVQDSQSYVASSYEEEEEGEGEGEVENDDDNDDDDDDDVEFPPAEKLFNLRQREKKRSYEDVPLAADEFVT